MPRETETIALVVTTKHRGVFYGYGIEPKDDIPNTIRLESARMCVSWSSSIRGVLGLAACGPDKSCRVGLKVPAITVNDITAVIKCSPKAVEAWEKGPWS